jgi:beta-phosphoglucomutase-like phosphatase (HAD superfamily)
MPVDFDRIKAICFDVDGTLSNTDDQFVRRLVRYFTPIRFLFGKRDIRLFARRLVMFTECPGNWVYGLADRIGWDDKVVAIGDRLYEMGIGDTEEPFLLIDGIREMLDILRNHYPLGIVSVRGKKSTYRFLFQYELLPFFKAVATGQTCSHTKPYPDPINWVAERMGVPPISCLMVGDTVPDILAGKKAGAQTVGVLCGFGEEKELRQAGADEIIQSTPDLIGLLSYRYK